MQALEKRLTAALAPDSTVKLPELKELAKECGVTPSNGADKRCLQSWRDALKTYDLGCGQSIADSCHEVHTLPTDHWAEPRTPRSGGSAGAALSEDPSPSPGSTVPLPLPSEDPSPSPGPTVPLQTSLKKPTGKVKVLLAYDGRPVSEWRHEVLAGGPHGLGYLRCPSLSEIEKRTQRLRQRTHFKDAYTGADLPPKYDVEHVSECQMMAHAIALTGGYLREALRGFNFRESLKAQPELYSRRLAPILAAHNGDWNLTVASHGTNMRKKTAVQECLEAHDAGDEECELARRLDHAFRNDEDKAPREILRQMKDAVQVVERRLTDDEVISTLLAAMQPKDRRALQGHLSELSDSFHTVHDQIMGVST